MLIPVVAYYLLFHYQPMYGLQIAFKDFSFSKGILGSPWAGFKHFESFFTSHYFWRLLRNTLSISVSNLLWGFPAPIILAIVINEIRSARFKKTVQTLTYLPHFVSVVVVCSMVKTFLSLNGPVNTIIQSFGGDPINFLRMVNILQRFSSFRTSGNILVGVPLFIFRLLPPLIRSFTKRLNWMVPENCVKSPA